MVTSQHSFKKHFTELVTTSLFILKSFDYFIFSFFEKLLMMSLFPDDRLCLGVQASAAFVILM